MGRAKGPTKSWWQVLTAPLNRLVAMRTKHRSRKTAIAHQNRLARQGRGSMLLHASPSRPKSTGRVTTGHFVRGDKK